MRTEIPVTVLDPLTSLPVSSAAVIVLNRVTGLTATVYVAESGGSVRSQPLATDAQGRVNGWVERGAYEVQITIIGRPTYSEWYDSAPASDGAIDTAWLAAGAVTTTKLATGAVTSNEIADGTVVTGDLANNAVTSAKLQSDGAVDGNRAVTTNSIRDNAVTAGKIAPGAVTANALASNVVPLGMVIDWWRASSGTAIPTGWALCDGTAWASISNDMGLSVGNIPNLVNSFTIGARLTVNSNGTGGAADGLASSVGSAYANAPGVGGTGGSNAAKNFGHTHAIAAHSHYIDHSHQLGGHVHNMNHYHPIVGSTGTVQGFSGSNMFETTGGFVIDHYHSLFINTFPPYTFSGGVQISNTGGPSGGSDAMYLGGPYGNGRSEAVGLTSTTPTWTSDPGTDVRPGHIGMLKIMKVKNI